jgi:toluene monooxygenase system ferredoxin subunit
MTDGAVMDFVRVCSLDDLWEGDMAVYEVSGQDILLVHAEGGTIAAFEPECPHQKFALVQGTLEGGTLTCAAHLWKFDASTGAGINPRSCKLKTYPVKIEGDDVFVAV